MASLSTKLSRLKVFFWTVLAFNLAEYASIAFYTAKTFKLSHAAENGTSGWLILFLFLLLLPILLIYQAIFILNKYFPARKFGPWRRGILLSLCIIQILSSVFFALVSFSGVLQEMPRKTRSINYNLVELPAFFMAIFIFLASLWSLVAAVVLWRMVNIIRRNYRNGAWESFEVG